MDKSKKKVITKCPFNKFDHRTKDAIRESMKWKILLTLLHIVIGHKPKTWKKWAGEIMNTNHILFRSKAKAQLSSSL